MVWVLPPPVNSDKRACALSALAWAAIKLSSVAPADEEVVEVLALVLPVVLVLLLPVVLALVLPVVVALVLPLLVPLVLPELPLFDGGVVSVTVEPSG